MSRALLLTLVVLASCRKAPPPAPKDEGEQLAEVAAAHRVGTPGPVLTLTTLDGQTLELGGPSGKKPVYLKFWATWCVPCREQMPKFETIYQTLGDRLDVIAVNAGFSDDEATVRAFREEHGLHMPMVIDDGRLAAALDLQVTPQHVLIGRDGRIAFIGHQDGAALDAALEKVLAQAPPSGPLVGQAAALHPAYQPSELVDGLTFQPLEGAPVTLAPGRPRALVFFSSWCESYLEKSRPHTSQACRRVREDVERLIARGDVDWLGVVGGPWTTAEDVRDYRKKTGTSLPLALDLDGDRFRAFGVHQLPTVALLSRDGRLARVLGPDDADLTAAVDALVK